MADKSKLYRYRYKIATVTVRADNPNQARYRAELALDYWKRTGHKPSDATIDVNKD